MNIILDEIIELENDEDDEVMRQYIDILKRKTNGNPINDKYVGCYITCRGKISSFYYDNKVNEFIIGWVVMHKHEYVNKELVTSYSQGYDSESSEEELEIIYPICYVFLTETAFYLLKIELICVETIHSGKGIGRLLMKKVFEYFEEYGFSKIILDAVDLEAVIFFEKFGFSIDKSRYIPNSDEKTTPMIYSRL